MKDLQELMSLWQQVEIQEKKKLDPVGQEDGDIDNDGDTDSSDEYLKNRRKAVGKSMGKSQKDEDCDCDLTDEKEPKKKVAKKEACGSSYSKKEGYGTKKESSAAYGASQQKIADKKKKDAMSSSDKDKLGKLAALMKKEGKMACPKCKGEGCDHCDGKGYHSAKKETYGKKMKESNLFSSEELAAIEEKMGPGATGGAPEKMGQTASAGEKKFADDHKKSDSKFETMQVKGTEDAKKAGHSGKQSPARRGDNLGNGDTKIRA